jgi:acetyl esterase/lipase
MLSPQAEAIHQRMRDAKANAPSPAPEVTIEYARERSIEFGAGTTQPEGVTNERVDANGVVAEWVQPAGADPSRVMMYFHGGGYTYGAMRSHTRLVGHMVKAAGCWGLNIDYRLAPEHPFPAAIEDGLAAYEWLLGRGVEGRHIALSGDSAGGGLALGLALKIRDSGHPLPGAIVPLSPWIDLANNRKPLDDPSRDLLQTQETTDRCAEYYLQGHDPYDPYVSALYGDWAGMPPLYIQIGDADMLLDDSRRMAERAREAGVDVRLDVLPDMQHVPQIWAGVMPEADEAIARIGDYLRAHLA